jgi:hypothetical protein
VKKPSRDLRAAPEWSRAVSEKNVGKRMKLVGTLADRVQGHDVQDLLRIAEHGSAGEREVAVGVLLTLVRQDNPHFKPDLRAEWLDLAKRNARSECPRGPVGLWSFRALMEADPKAAEELLVRGVSLDNLKPPEYATVIRQLAAFGTARALARLQDIERLGGEAGKQATRTLENLVVMSREKLEALAKKWRQRHDRDALNRIYGGYINHLPAGSVSMAELQDLLGKPTRRSDRDLWYETEGATLFLESDDHGRLRGRKLS